MEDGISNKTIVRFLLSQQMMTSKKLHCLFICLFSLFQVGIYNSIKTNKNQSSSSYKE